MPDGSVLGVNDYGDGNDHYVLAHHSTDGGWNWTHLATIDDYPSTHNIGNVNVVRLSSGRLLVAYRNHQMANNKNTFYRITLQQSTDNGTTWSYLTTIRTKAGGKFGSDET